VSIHDAWERYSRWGLASSSSCVPGKDGVGLTKECSCNDSHFRRVAPHPHANHWSTQETMKSFVQKVLHPYFEGKCFDFGLNLLTQRMIWLIDYWSVHISTEFRGFMKENFPHILLLFVPANCTSKLQLMDVIFQRPFKHAIHQLYNQFQAAEIAKQIKAGVDPSKVKLQTTAA